MGASAAAAEALAALEAVLQSAAHRCDVEQPHACSSAVAFVTRQDTAPPQTVAVAKVRDDVREAALELFNFLCSAHLGLDVVSPCLAVVRAPDSAGLDPMAAVDTVAAQLDRLQASHRGPGEYYVVVEQFQPVLPKGLPTAADDAASHVLRQLGDGHPRGAIDLWQATLGSPSGAAIADLLDDDRQAALGIADRDLPALMAAICPKKFERFCLFAALSCQMDISPENVMLRGVPTAASGASGVELVLIDTGLSWPPFDELLLDLCGPEDEETPASYWFPSMLFLPPAEEPLSLQGRDFLAGLTSERLTEAIAACAVEVAHRLHLEAPTQVVPAEAVQFAVARLARMQAAAATDPGLSLRGLCFAAVPAWRRDWPGLLALPGVQAYMALLATGQLPYSARLHWALGMAQDAGWPLPALAALTAVVAVTGAVALALRTGRGAWRR
eukprot:EG_transcript_9122